MTPTGMARRPVPWRVRRGTGAGEAVDTSGVSPPTPAPGEAARERGSRAPAASPGLDHFE